MLVINKIVKQLNKFFICALMFMFLSFDALNNKIRSLSIYCNLT